jgi:hypothetical protein
MRQAASGMRLAQAIMENHTRPKAGHNGGASMIKIVFSAIGLAIAYAALERVGSPEAALWLTGAFGCCGLICYGLARA